MLPEAEAGGFRFEVRGAPDNGPWNTETADVGFVPIACAGDVRFRTFYL
jgi:hypothetical protein